MQTNAGAGEGGTGAVAVGGADDDDAGDEADVGASSSGAPYVGRSAMMDPVGMGLDELSGGYVN
ncbi:hypothetical protein HDU93_001918 [Gonapodya sp. JEL0774]|nr:hypothetical protein HDU93_001918 [Gonapodya sp. JEL0774]